MTGITTDIKWDKLEKSVVGINNLIFNCFTGNWSCQEKLTWVNWQICLSVLTLGIMKAFELALQVHVEQMLQIGLLAKFERTVCKTHQQTGTFWKHPYLTVFNYWWSHRNIRVLLIR